MAVTENLYTGDGSTVLYSFTFPYLATTDVKVSLDGSDTTAYSLANATQVQLNSAPASGVAIRVYRDTADDALSAEFFPGAAIKSSDLNNNFTQSLYVTQESNDIAGKATTTANTAKTTADSATTTANSAVTTANTASTNATSAVNTANTASTNATTAVNTANSAVTTANAASATATAAQNAVANAVLYTPVANVSSIPGSPSNNDYVEVQDSTGIQSFTPLSGLPSGFTGASGLTVRLVYTTSGSTWQWQNYFANDPEDRYFTKSAGDTNTTNIGTKMPLAGGTFTGAVNFDDNVVIKGDTTNGSGKLTLNCENNSHGVNIKGPPHSAGATYTLTLPDDTGTNGQSLTTDGSGGLSWSSVSAPVASVNGNTGTVVLTASDVGAATTAQGTLADSALQSSDIGVSIQAYDANLPSGSTILVDADVGVGVQAYDADTAKTDVAQSFTAAQRGSITTLTSGATVTPDFAAANNYTLTLGHNATIANPTNLTAGQSGSIFLVQDGTGSRTAAWGSYWDFAGGTAPTLTTDANGVDRVDYVVRSATSIHAVATLNYS